MKKLYFTLMFCTVLIATAHAQCDTYVEIVQGVECLLPKVISTQDLLLPCTSPVGFNQLVIGDFAMIGFTFSSCGSFCMQGIPVDINCFYPVYVGIGETKHKSSINLYPNPTTN